MTIIQERAAHRRAFIHKETDEAAWLGQRQRFAQHMRRLVFFAGQVVAHHLENHRSEPLIRPPPSVRVPTDGFQYGERGGRVTLSDKHTRPAEREVVLPGQLSGCRDLALVKQGQDLDGGNLWHLLREASLARRLVRLRQHGGSATAIAAGESHTGQVHFADNKSVNRGIILPRQLKALSAVPLGRLQIVPLVAYASQANILFVGIRWPLIAE